MKLPNLLPPADLLEQVEGIESGLRQRKRLGAIGWIGLIISTLEITVLIINSDWWAGLTEFDWKQLLTHWPTLLSLAIFVLFGMLVAWSRFWLNESKQPFCYTFYVSGFEPVENSVAKEAKMAWLRHDLLKRLNERIRRLSLLDEELVSKDAEHASDLKPEAHIHIGGHYIIRRTADKHWVVEIMPRVRIGWHGRPETLAHVVRFRLKPNHSPGASPTKQESHSAEPSSTPTNVVSLDVAEKEPGADSETPQAPEQESLGYKPLETQDYDRIVERVYFSVATEIYRQIRQDVQGKIDLLPTRRFRAAAYFHEAEDYARSNTLDAYDEARKLYFEAMKLCDPTWHALPQSPWRSLWLRIMHVNAWLGRRLRRWGASVWPRFGQDDVTAARGEIGYASMLIYRRILAMLSGLQPEPVFQAKSAAQKAIERLSNLPEIVPSRNESLFDGYVTLALACLYLGSARQARIWLAKAQRLDPSRVESDAQFLYTKGELEDRYLSKLPFYQRAVEIDPKFEIAQFQLAITSEMLWRCRASFEKNVGEMVVDEYEKVLGLNPGNIGAWANTGYMLWLLADKQKDDDYLARAEEAFEYGREYKEIKRETFVSELDYGLARLAAERGDFRSAYKHYTQAVTAQLAHGVWQLGMTYTAYFFEPISDPVWERFREYRDNFEKCLSNVPPETPERVRNAVCAFVLDDYGMACFYYYRRSGYEPLWGEAESAFEQAKRQDPSSVMPHYHLYQLYDWKGYLERAKSSLEDVLRREPHWADPLLGLARVQSRLAFRRRDSQEIQQKENESRELRRRAVMLRLLLKKRLAEDTMQQAVKLGEDAERLSVESATILEQSLALIRRLLPHQRLLGSKRRTLFSLVDLEGKYVRHLLRSRHINWETDLNELHVRALIGWADILGRQTEKPKTIKAACQLLQHIERHYYLDQWDTLWLLRATVQSRLADLQAKADKEVLPTFHRLRTRLQTRQEQKLRVAKQEYDKSIRRLVLRDLAGDPASVFLLKWLDNEVFQDNGFSIATQPDDTLRKETKTDFLLDATRAPGVALLGLLWLVERLGGLADELDQNDKQEDAERALKGVLEACDRAAKLVDNGDPRVENSLEAFDRVMKVGVAHRAQYLKRVSSALWALGRHDEALTAFEALGREQAKQNNDWRVDLVRGLLGRINTTERYHLIKVWLEREQARSLKGSNQQAWADAHRAGMYLVREKYRKLESGIEPPQWISQSETPLVGNPITVEIDDQLARDWSDEHPVIKVHLPEMRYRIQSEMGVPVPGVRIRANTEADWNENTYLISILEVPTVRGFADPARKFFPGYHLKPLALKAGIAIPDRASNPLTGDQDGAWIDPDHLRGATAAEVECWDYAEYILYHLEAVLKAHLALFLTWDTLEKLVSDWEGVWFADDWLSRSGLRERALPDDEAKRRLLPVLQGLLEEKVPIRDLSTILSVFAHTDASSASGVEAIEQMRLALREVLPGNEGHRQLIRLSPDFEQILAENVTEERFLALERESVRDLLAAVRERVAGQSLRYLALVVRTPGLRPFVWRLIQAEFPDLPVLAERELIGAYARIGEPVEYVRS